MDNLILPTTGKETVLVLNSLEEGLKVTLFPQYQTGRMVRSARMVLTGIARGDMGGHMIALPEGDVNDSRSPKVLVSLDLCTSAQEKQIDVPADVKAQIDEYTNLVSKEELSDEEEANLIKVESGLRSYFGGSRNMGL